MDEMILQLAQDIGVIDELNKEADALKEAIERIQKSESINSTEWTHRPDKKERKKEKLPKKLRNGWS